MVLSLIDPLLFFVSGGFQPSLTARMSISALQVLPGLDFVAYLVSCAPFSAFAIFWKNDDWVIRNQEIILVMLG